jgi:hypothetical protein
MVAHALHRATTYGEPTVPRLLASDPGAVPFDETNQLGQGMADGCFPGLPPLEVIGGAADVALAPRELRATPVHRSKRSFATQWGPSSSRRRIEAAHVVGEVSHL